MPFWSITCARTMCSLTCSSPSGPTQSPDSTRRPWMRANSPLPWGLPPCTQSSLEIFLPSPKIMLFSSLKPFTGPCCPCKQLQAQQLGPQGPSWPACLSSLISCQSRPTLSRAVAPWWHPLPLHVCAGASPFLHCRLVSDPPLWMVW